MANLACRPGWRGTGNNNNAVNFYQVNLGKKSHAGKILGGGTSSDPVTSTTASEKLASFYTSSSATSGETYGFYWKHTLTGAAGSLTCGRFYAYTNVAADTIQGAQISVATGSSGKASGLMVGCRAQAQFAANATASTGTIAGGQSELYFDGSGSSTSTVAGARCSIHRFIIDGDATAKATVPYVLEFVGLGSEGSGEELLSTKYVTASAGLRCIIDNVKYRILLDKE